MKTIKKVVTKEYTPRWYKENFSKFNETWKNIRGKMSYKGFSCFICDEPYKDDQPIHLVSFNECGNKVVCDKCLFEVKKITDDETGPTDYINSLK